jgi:hypothetical protein
MKYLFIIIICALLIISCKKDKGITEVINSEIVSNGKANDILPLTVGNTWNYKEYEYHNDKLLIERDVKLEVLSEVVINYNGEKLEAFKLKETRYFSENNIGELYFLLRNENDTIYWYGHAVSDNNRYYFNKTIYIKYPIQVGENWIMNHGDYQDIFNCESVNDIVTINNINYECVRIRMGPGNWYEDKYFSPGIGIIQIESTSGWEENSNLTKQILVSNVIK